MIRITDAVAWVGKIDWELRKFHGDEYSTHRGSSYNAFLVRDKKSVLIDTVWKPFAAEFIANLEKNIDLRSIDAIVANHAEIDHSGALPLLLERIPQVPVYCTANGIKSLKGHFHTDWNFQVVKTGDTLNLGNRELVFIEAPMLHWPDSMMTYLTQDHILFSNDAFGQHYASELLFNDLVNQDELYTEALKYYANILTPFSSLVVKKIEEVLSLGLPVEWICPSHGIIWRKNPLQIVEKYLEWAKEYRENKITIVYDTMWEGTRKVAEALAKGIIQESPQTEVKLFNLSKTDKNDVIAEVFRSKAILAGSPTINRGMLTSLAAFFEEVRGLGFKGKKASAFGCYGWSGESVKMLAENLERSGFKVVGEGLKTLWEPDGEALKEAQQYGVEFAQQS
ncbi:MAG TPA: anaerobic nitric oxide reductase flavorubredoxin [Spirochaetales bacterium]|nr:anaerobic nitric oxide reductase flavorubredoxin [Spirochaetales bacterium]